MCFSFTLRGTTVKNLKDLTLFIPGFLAGIVLGSVFYLQPLSLKSEYSNFVQNYFGVRSMLCSKKNQDQIDNDITICHLCSDEC